MVVAFDPAYAHRRRDVSYDARQRVPRGVRCASLRCGHGDAQRRFPDRTDLARARRGGEQLARVAGAADRRDAGARAMSATLSAAASALDAPCVGGAADDLPVAT